MGVASGRSTPHPVAQTLNIEFDDKVSYVRRYAGRVEKELVLPALKYGQSAFEKRPLSSLFLSIFFLLSAIPLFIFILSVFCITVCLVSIAVGAAIVASFIISLGFFSVLFTALIGIFFTSILVTLGTIGALLSCKLLFLTWRDGKDGVYDWLKQTKQQSLYILGFHEKATPSPDRTPQINDSGVALSEDSMSLQEFDIGSGYTTDSGYKIEG